MAQVKIYGIPQSTYVRTVRMTCEEKGVGYDLVPLAPQSPEMLEKSPTGKVPAFDHGDLHLYETSAIARYIDEAFDGPALQPSDVHGRAYMNQYISEINDTIYETMLRQIVLPRLGITHASDEALSASAAVMDKQLTRLDQHLQSSEYLVGESLTLADLFLVPILFWVEKTPEGQATMASKLSFGRWYESMRQRESFQATIPPMPS